MKVSLSAATIVSVHTNRIHLQYHTPTRALRIEFFIFWIKIFHFTVLKNLPIITNKHPSPPLVRVRKLHKLLSSISIFHQSIIISLGVYDDKHLLLTMKPLNISRDVSETELPITEVYKFTLIIITMYLCLLLLIYHIFSG